MDVVTPPFDPTRPPLRRLVRLGVVFDGRTPSSVVPALARMCDRAGIDIVWVSDPLPGTALAGDADAWPLASHLLGGQTRASVGAMLDGRPGRSDPATVANLTRASTPAAGANLELCRIDQRMVANELLALRDRLSSFGTRARLSAVAAPDEPIRSLLGVVDDIVISAWVTPDIETAADEARAAAIDAGRDPGTLGVGALVPVSLGRTEAEASARAHMDADFLRFGHPADIGIFGTLEACQDRVIALAHAGVTDLRCVLPATHDIHDVIAQLTAMTIGSVEVLVPGSLRSPAPPPPSGWGGRPDRPPSPATSSGSRRRNHETATGEA